MDSKKNKLNKKQKFCRFFFNLGMIKHINFIRNTHIYDEGSGAASSTKAS